MYASRIFSSFSQSGFSLDEKALDEIGDSQANLQLEVERSRIIDIINDCVNNLCITLCLDTFIDNAEVWLAPYCTEEEMRIINKGLLLQHYKKDQETKIENEDSDNSSNTSLSGLNSVKFQSNAIIPTDNPSLCDALQILFKNPNIINLTRSMVNDPKRKVLSSEFEIFTAFSQLSEFFIDRLNIRADEERRNDVYLVTVWDKNEAAKNKIIELEKELGERRSKYLEVMDAKKQYISRHEDIISNTNLECEQQILQNTLIAERRMADDWHESVDKQQELKELCRQIRNEMETLVSNHVFLEKQSRAKRLKIEMQLLAWIKKYDDEMGDRQDRFDILLKQFEDEKFILLEMTKKFEEQEQIYTELMREKHEYLHQTWSEKVSHFIRNIAARHIQRWYRRILKTTAAKRKAALKASKKGKKGKSSAKAAIVKSAPSAISPTKDVVDPKPISHEQSIESRRTSMSSRRASTVPFGVTKIQTEPREMNVDENYTEENEDDKKLPKFGYVSTFFKPPTEEETNNSIDNVELF